MDLRDIFTRDLLSDHELVAAYTFCLREVQPIPMSVRYQDQRIDLRPYEILIENDRVERELGLGFPLFLEKVKWLESLRRLELRSEPKYLRILLKSIRFPLGAVEEVRDHGQDIIPITLSRWTEKDLDAIGARGDARDYQAMVRQVLNRFRLIVGEKHLTEITSFDYTTWQNAILGNGASKSSFNNYRRAINASFNRAVNHGFLKANPFERMSPLRTVSNRAKIVEVDEMAALFVSIAHQWLKDVILFAVCSTKRHGEILNLKWEDVDFENRLVSIHSSPEYRVKFGKEQTLPLSDELETLLRKIERGQQGEGFVADHIFLDERGKPLTERKVRETLKEARDMAGLGDHVTIHGMRRTAATKLKQKGVTTNTIRGILNHGDEKVTNRYLGVPREDEADALNMLSPQDFFPTGRTEPQTTAARNDQQET